MAAKNWATALSYAHSPYPTSATTQVPWKWRLNFTLPAPMPTSGNVTLASADHANEFVYVNNENTPFTTFYPDSSGGNGFIRQTNYAKYAVKEIAIPMARLRAGANTIYPGHELGLGHGQPRHVRLHQPLR